MPKPVSRPVFASGDSVGGVRVLKVIEPSARPDFIVYKVECLHCGKQYRSLGKTLFNRKRKGTVRCQGCAKLA